MDDQRKMELFSYLSSIRIHFLISISVFVLFMLIGYVTYGMYPDEAIKSLAGLEGMVDSIKDLSPFGVMLRIFINNAMAMFFAIVFGVILGLVPLFVLLLNGFVIGTVIHMLAAEHGFLFIAAGLIPHGVIEIPMLLLSTSIGLRIGVQVWNVLLKRPSNAKEELAKGIQFFFNWMLVLIFLAALIETFITPSVISMVIGS